MSPRWHFNKQNIDNVVGMMLHLAIGGALMVVTQLLAYLLAHYSFGEYAPILIMIYAVLSKTIGQWVSGPVCTQTSVVAPVMPVQQVSTNTPDVQPAPAA